jgi:hypothetical protein
MDNHSQFLGHTIKIHFTKAKNDLMQEMERISSCTERNHRKNPVADMHEKMVETEELISIGSTRLAEICSKNISEFEHEVQEMKESRITDGTQIFKDLLIKESQKLIRDLITGRFCL